MTQNVILSQLGGSKFIAMTGAKNFLSYGSGKGLQMDLPKNESGANKLQIELQPSDTYTFIFLNYSKATFSVTSKKEITGVYCDNMQQVFTEVTGLVTSL